MKKHQKRENKVSKAYKSFKSLEERAKIERRCADSSIKRARIRKLHKINSLTSKEMTPEQIVDFQAIADKYALAFSVTITPAVPATQTTNFAPGVPSEIV